MVVGENCEKLGKIWGDRERKTCGPNARRGAEDFPFSGYTYVGGGGTKNGSNLDRASAV
jgi:hypothetical protein